MLKPHDKEWIMEEARTVSAIQNEVKSLCGVRSLRQGANRSRGLIVT